jgi:hypothetical protein
MSRKASNAPSAKSGRDELEPDVHDAGQRPPERGRAGLLRRRRNVPGGPSGMGACPTCGLRSRDAIAAQLGFCDRCREFTGMCGAGRRIVCPDVMTRTTWHTPCTELGLVPWDITQVQGRCRTLLCRAHDTQVRFGGTPWIVAAVPLDPAGSSPRKSASVPRSTMA